MLKKQLMKKVYIDDQQTKGQGFELEYYFTHNDNDMYGVEIKKKINTNLQEEKHIFDIVRNKETTINILNRLARNQVTPVSFEDVIEDYLV